VLPSLLTITAPFTGKEKSLPINEITEALQSMSSSKGKLPKISIGKFVPLVSQKAGPNGAFATWSAGIDAIAFIHEPQKLYLLCRWLYSQSAYKWIVLFVFLIICFSPIYYILLKTNRVRKLELGKLGVVYNQAGKARVVAATNWWLQSAFGSLHKNIFTLLKSIKQDGTFDQEKAFNNMLVRSDFRENLSGFDLSAATDRLPIEIQEDILNILGLPGTEWKNLLNFDWLYIVNEDTIVNDSVEHNILKKDRSERLHIKYTVGQPMGALSSWAMLALAHHVISRIAFIRNGMKPEFGNYCVLGDDIVINNNKAANTYLELMEGLGLKISLGKSVISTRFTEFAKKLRGPFIDISPIGAGIILSATRSAYYLPVLVLNAIKIFCLTPEGVLELIRNLPGGLFNKKAATEIIRTTLLMTFANNTWYREISLINVRTLRRYSNFFSADIGKFADALYVTLITFAENEIQLQKDNAHKVLQSFISESFATFSTRDKAMRLLELLMKPFNPGFWIYIFDAFALPHKIDELDVEIHSQIAMIPADKPYDRVKYLFSKDPRASVMDLANLKDHEAKLVSKYYLKIYASLQYKLYL
jgi:hypothetical protein